MKNIITLTAAVLCGTMAFADGTHKAPTSTTSVVNSGTGTIKLFYTAEKSNRVTVTIINERREQVFSENLTSEKFMRPYNLKNLPEGQYTIRIEDESGTHFEKVNYQFMELGKKVNISKAEVDGRYLISGIVPSTESLSVNIYDAENKVLYHDIIDADGRFAKLYNLSAIKGTFTIEVLDSNGLVKDLSGSLAN